MNRHLTRICGLLGALCAGALATPYEAHAYQGFSAFQCHIAQHDWPHVIASAGNGLENRSGNPGSRQMVVSCPLPNLNNDFTSVFITGFDGNNENHADLGQFRVRGCAISQSLGGGCSANSTVSVASPTHTGGGRFSLPSGVLSGINAVTTGYRYLDVSIPRPGVRGNSRLVGYEVNP